MKKKTKKPVENKTVQTPALVLTFCATLSVLTGLAAGYLFWNKEPQDPRYPLATQQQIDTAVAAITRKFQDQSSTDCADDSDPINPEDRVEVFQRYLKVNKYANRAVIRGCGNIDSFLVPDMNGEWQITPVNVSLDTRANPLWQVECMADDILEADDVVRPENSSIDTTNYLYCQRLRDNDLLLSMYRKDLEAVNEKTSPEGFEQYLQAVRAGIDQL